MAEQIKNLYLYLHLGLGDTVLCNGLIRRVKEKVKNNLYIFCKPKNYTSVSFMFRDLKGLEIIQLDDYEVLLFLQKISPSQKIIIGQQYLPYFLSQGLTFDQAFYKQIGLNFESRWNDYYILRDNKREEDLFLRISPPSKYIFIHEDPTRNFFIDRKYITPNVSIISSNPELTDNVFDYLKIIENASEIHCMDSTFKHIIDSHDIQHSNLFYHTYIRGTGPGNVSQSKLNWKII